VGQCTGVEDWDRVADEPDALPPAWRRRARREHLDLLDGWIDRPAGCWLKTDLFEEGLADRALLPSLASARWVGTDVSPAVVARAGAAARTAVVADARALPFRCGAFDGVLSTSTLDHFDDARDIDRSLVELARVLRPGGRLVLTLDNAANPLVAARNALPRRVARRSGLVPFEVGETLDEAGGRRALAEAGLEVDAVEHLLHAPHIVGTRLAAVGWWAEHVLPRFSALARTRLASRTGHFVAFLASAPTTHPSPGRPRGAGTAPERRRTASSTPPR
jgi:SAM-dependent methyltransferase